MARIRTIKPEFWRDEDLSEISAEAALLAIGLLNHADDEGYFNANERLIAADVFPLRKLSRTIPVLLRELSDIGYLVFFSGSDGKKYGRVANFHKHQVINKKTPSKIKELCEVPEDYGSTPVGLPMGKERKGKDICTIDQFWETYGKKVGKGKCLAIWKSLNVDPLLNQTIVSAAQAYVAATPDPKFRKDPERWLRDRRWEDEIELSAKPSQVDLLIAASQEQSARTSIW